jgi:phosphoenolpyruvate-protein kinase (PTS system EI component)
MAVLSEEIILQGTPVASGLALGNLFLLCNVHAEVPQFAIADKDVDHEVQRFGRPFRQPPETSKKFLRV